MTCKNIFNNPYRSLIQWMATQKAAREAHERVPPSASQWHAWNKVVGAAIIVSGFSVAAFNLYFDPYEIFGTSPLSRKSYTVNERYGKIEHIKKNIGQYNSYIIGASTMGMFEPATAEKYSPGSRYYNMSYVAGMPTEALATLKYIKAHGGEIKEVVYGLDLFAFKKFGKDEPFKRMHPEVSGESKLSFYKQFLFASSLMHGINRIEHSVKPKPDITFDIDGTGRYYLEKLDREHAADLGGYVKAHFKHDPHPIEMDIKWVDERFDEFKELVNWLRENNVRAVFWVNPIHKNMREVITDKSYAEFKHRITKITGPIPDFSLNKELSTRNEWYYEIKHFRTNVADMILAVVLGGRDVDDLINNALTNDATPQRTTNL